MPTVRFHRRISIIPGLLYLNLSKGGFSISFGLNGLTLNFGKNGIRFTAGLPGTGLSASEHVNYRNVLKK